MTIRITKRIAQSAIGTLVILITLAIGILIGSYPTRRDEIAPYCPTEDSCYADYHHGRWNIIENQP